MRATERENDLLDAGERAAASFAQFAESLKSFGTRLSAVASETERAQSVFASLRLRDFSDTGSTIGNTIRLLNSD